MTQSIVVQLALKDFYLSRWVVITSLAAGAVSLAVAPLDPVAFYVGSVSFICVLIVLNIFLVMSGVTQEKKDKVRLFVLSLPVSTTQYTLAKVAANFAAFALPWLLLTGGCLVLIALTAIPDGLMPIALAVSTYLLGYYCVLLGVSVATESQMWPSVVILCGNIGVNLLIPMLFRTESGRAYLASPDVVSWGSDIVATIALQLAAGVLGLTIGIVRQTRKRDFV